MRENRSPRDGSERRMPVLNSLRRLEEAFSSLWTPIHSLLPRRSALASQSLSEHRRTSSLSSPGNMWGPSGNECSCQSCTSARSAIYRCRLFPSRGARAWRWRTVSTCSSAEKHTTRSEDMPPSGQPWSKTSGLHGESKRPAASSKSGTAKGPSVVACTGASKRSGRASQRMSFPGSTIR